MLPFSYDITCTLDVRLVPDFSLTAGGGNGLVADLQNEITLLEGPAAVGSYEGEGLGGELEGDGLGLARLKFNLREVTQTAVVGNDGGNEVTRVEQDGFLAGTAARVLHVDANRQDVVSLE